MIYPFRLSAMQEALENLSGVSIGKVELLDNDDLSLLLRVKDCDVRIVIDQEKKLSSIEVSTFLSILFFFEYSIICRS